MIMQVKGCTNDQAMQEMHDGLQDGDFHMDCG